MTRVVERATSSIGRRSGPQEEAADLPGTKQARFRGRRFIDPDPPDRLDHAGAEFILIGADEHPARELQVDLRAQEESESSAEIFRDLRLRQMETPLKPLFKGSGVHGAGNCDPVRPAAPPSPAMLEEEHGC